MKHTLNSLVHARWFERTILGVILLAGLLAGLETSAPVVARHGSVLKALDAVVLAVFIIEIVLKMAAHGRRPWQYFRDGWNVFDFVIVALCCLPMHTQSAAVLRLARALRLLRLLTALPRLQLLVGALLKSLGAMGYVGLLLLMMFYIYGVAGVHLFQEADAAHFGTLPLAMLSLFQLITLDNWSEVYRAVEAVSPVGAIVYFVSFILLGTMIMLNLFIGIIMNSMSEMHDEIAERDRTKHIAETGDTTLEDELRRMERQIEGLRQQTMRLRRHLNRGLGADPARSAATLCRQSSDAPRPGMALGPG